MINFRKDKPAAAIAQTRDVQAPATAQQVSATAGVAKAPLLVGMGPSQEHGTLNDKALQVFQAALDNTEVTLADSKMRGRRGERGVRPRDQAKEPARPFEDPYLVAVPVDKKVKAKELGPAAFFDEPATARRKPADVLKMWASTTHAHLWTTNVGKAMAGFAVDRYAHATVQFDQRGKLEHVVEVLNNADRIALDQENHGQALDPKWREYLEYAAMLHDIGYKNGGFLHPKKGGNDIMYHMREALKEHGVDDKQISDVDLEKISLVVELHGDAFPWNMIGDDQDARRLSPGRGGGAFGDFPYLSLAVVEQIFAQPGRTEQFVDIMKKENEVYIGETKGLSWLDDPAQVKELIRTGYVMHAADKYKCPSSDMLELRKGRGKPGASIPFTSIQAVDNSFRNRDARGMLSNLRGALDAIIPRTVALEKNEKARATLEQKVLEPLYDMLGTVSALIAQLDSDVDNTKKSRSLGDSLKTLAGSHAIDRVQTEIDRLPKAAQKLVDEGVMEIFQNPKPIPLGELLKLVIESTAQGVSKLPDLQPEPPAP
jgi:hypothetical protein